MNGECLAENIIYEATLSTDDVINDTPMKYIGLTATTFKKRFSNHKKSFNYKCYENETELSKHFWNLKRANKNPTVAWEIVRRTGGFQRSSLNTFAANYEYTRSNGSDTNCQLRVYS